MKTQIDKKDIDIIISFNNLIIIGKDRITIQKTKNCTDTQRNWMVFIARDLEQEYPNTELRTQLIFRNDTFLVRIGKQRITKKFIDYVQSSDFTPERRKETSKC